MVTMHGWSRQGPPLARHRRFLVLPPLPPPPPGRLLGSSKYSSSPNAVTMLRRSILMVDTLPSAARRRGAGELQIWSRACGSGIEAGARAACTHRQAWAGAQVAAQHAGGTLQRDRRQARRLTLVQVRDAPQLLALFEQDEHGQRGDGAIHGHFVRLGQLRPPVIAGRRVCGRRCAGVRRGGGQG